MNLQNKVTRVADKASKDTEEFRDKIIELHASFLNAADITKVETLAMIIEQQRQRIDSVIQGSTAIIPINKEFNLLESKLNEIQDFLQFSPADKKLPLQLKEVGEMLQSVSGVVSEQGSAIGRAAMLIKSVESNVRQLDARVSVLENSSEKTPEVIQKLDLTGKSR